MFLATQSVQHTNNLICLVFQIPVVQGSEVTLYKEEKELSENGQDYCRDRKSSHQLLTESIVKTLQKRFVSDNKDVSHYFSFFLPVSSL